MNQFRLSLFMLSVSALATSAQAQEAYIPRAAYVAPGQAAQGQATYLPQQARPAPVYGQTRGRMGGGLIEAMFGNGGVPAEYARPGEQRRVVMAPPQAQYTHEPLTPLPGIVEDNRMAHPSHADLSRQNMSGWNRRPVMGPERPPIAQRYPAQPLVTARIQEPALATSVREEFSAPRGFDARFLPQTVSYTSPHGPGTVVIDTAQKYLYLIEGNGQARRYGIGVGRPGFSWKGVKHVTRKAEWPDWRPPGEMLKRRPDLPKYMAGGPNNPLGARAMYLGSSMYRIHGSNEPDTIGQAVSSGCFRMRNEDVIDLYNRVRVGTKVVVS